MPPTRKARRNSTASASSKSTGRTPKGPARVRAMITQRQKQALIDNLQLEITDRARRLRGLYARQAQSLHTRIEMRVNRIPTSLRKLTMGELLEKHSESERVEKQVKPTARPTSSQAPSKPTAMKASKPQPVKRGLKRPSDMLEDDKENTPDLNQQAPAPKKRAKVGEGRAPNPATVLSPKSSNSRTLPQSPIRSQLAATQKGGQTRPVSPLKGISPAKVSAPAAASTAGSVHGEKARTTRTVASGSTTRKAATRIAAEVKPYAARTKRGLAVTGGVDRAASSSSNASAVSGTSAATTIVKKVGRTLTSTTRAKKATAAAASTTKKTTAVRARTTATGTATRSLRKRA